MIECKMTKNVVFLVLLIFFFSRESEEVESSSTIYRLHSQGNLS